MINRLIYKLNLIANTVKYLKFQQVFYQIFYRLKNLARLKQNHHKHFDIFVTLKWKNGIHNLNTYNGGLSFKFINIEHDFTDRINWNEKSNNKLWLYNLSYFDYLNQKTITKKEGLFLIYDFIENYSILKDAKEAYPSSLRIINFIKFISKHNIHDPLILEVIKEDANRLSKNIEFHLLGNHILENGFALWFSANLFNDKRFYAISNKILKDQLNEQVLNDGGHFELSPMYHILMLYRVLDCINLNELNPNIHNEERISLFKYKASKMVSWLNRMTFKNGDFPLFNDSANGINPTSIDILEYAKALKIKNINIPLSDSGYRDFRTSKYELIADVGEIGASYQPAHAHADTLNFELYVEGRPIIVDTGISTYNLIDTRIKERSTKAHNTVTINDKNSSQVWSSFRVAKRANITIIKDSPKILNAYHNGYEDLGVTHSRQWSFNDNQITIYDSLNKLCEGKAHIHFHPKAIISLKKDIILVNKNIEISFENLTSIKLSNYFYNSELNKPISARKVELIFKKELTSIFKIK